ncbi:Gamma-tubulin complex component protein [Trinorchestia longiramus]|nr:Gamma-tubulin complex component protein [Trinorchestia longiramus]
MVMPYAPTLSVLASLVADVEEGEVRGCRLLETVHCHCRDAVHHTALLNRLDQSVHGVLYDQLSHWLLYGALLDPFKEFFLQAQVTREGAVGLEPDLLPAHLPASLAHSILFIGHAVRDFDASPTKKEGRIGGPLEEGEEGFLEQLTALSRAKMFSVTRLSDTVHSIRATVSKHMCKVTLDGGLVCALEELKSLLLLGRGELFHALLTIAADALDPSADSAYTNVGALVQMCAQQVQVQEDLLDKFTFYCSLEAQQLLPQVVRDTKGHGTTGWSTLNVEYKCSRVLKQVLGCAAVQRQYKQLFTFLLCVRRAQHRLHNSILSYCTASRRSKADLNGGVWTAWTLRHRITLLIDGLQYYLQVDVLESEHYHLVTSVKECGDYEQLQCLVASYLTSLTRLCFLSHSLVSKCLSLLFSLCHELCDVLSCNSGSRVSGKRTLEELSEDLESCCSRLFLVLGSLQQLPGQQHTASLLDRLDYNHYYRKDQLHLSGKDDSSTSPSLMF